MFSQRFPRAAERRFGAPPWLRVIHAANGIEPLFGNPTSTATVPGIGYVEVYPDAEVLFPADDEATVQISATTERGDRVLTQAAQG